jgi:DNA-binding IclR family transcriptional regulator
MASQKFDLQLNELQSGISFLSERLSANNSSVGSIRLSADDSSARQPRAMRPTKKSFAETLKDDLESLTEQLRSAREEKRAVVYQLHEVIANRNALIVEYWLFNSFHHH